MRTRTFVAAAAVGVSLCACQGLQDALSSHSNAVVRTVGSEELTVTELSNLLGNAKIPVQVTKVNATTLATIWADYHRLAYAAAHNDTLKEHVDAAVTPLINNQRVAMFMDTIMKKARSDTATEALYNQGGGDIMDARHILFGYPQGVGAPIPPNRPPTAAERDAAKKLAESIRPEVTAANFAAMAKKYSKDPGSAADSGNLGPFPKAGQGSMMPEFYNGTAALKPGEISAPIESPYGFHIIQRLPWSEAKTQYSQAYGQAAAEKAYTAIFDAMSKAADLQLNKGAVTAVRTATGDLHAHNSDQTVLATYNRGGKFTVADFITWLDVLPPDRRQQIVQGIPQTSTPDSVIANFLKQIALQPVILRSADSAKVDPLLAKRDTLRDQFRQLVVEYWKQLNVAPDQLSDSAKSASDRQHLAARRVDAYIDKFMAGEEQPSIPPVPIEQVLDAQYGATINAAAVDKVVVQGGKVRAAADSARSASEPSSAIPMPMGSGAGGGPPGAGQGGPPSPPPATKAPPAKKPPSGDR